jgi:NAD(P)-dependent dehydrogenase (short-subunit alcohol dehydrogenase family)
MNKIDYKDKVCVVTGAASGIGYATVKMLLEMEAKVYALDINEVNIDNLITIKVDLSSKDSIDDAFERLPEHIDCFFGVAGLSGAITNYYKTFTVNYISNKYITEEYLSKRMSTGGAICYVTSTAGLHWEKYQKEYQLFTKAKTWEDMIHVLEYQARPDTLGVMAYPLSKRAMNHYMAEAAYKIGEQGIRVNALLPGSTDTGMKKEFEVEVGGEEQLVSHTGVAKRLATPEEMAEPLIFLNSDMARFISGETLVVDYASTAMSYIGITKDAMDMKVGSKFFNLGFVQKKLKKQLEPLQNETKETTLLMMKLMKKLLKILMK